ncbi:hypothetical protein BJ878DRAFT_318982 [Calycina marina]|uniref:RING-CH-type domain-containing protein n=1 Tax=Calycina marina TaxID=1763456 RepID=A0A9P7YVF7_9HELO|nr:hypothetical protein BJ878DRAFT_318982 [Calycina marina]
MDMASGSTSPAGESALAHVLTTCPASNEIKSEAPNISTSQPEDLSSLPHNTTSAANDPPLILPVPKPEEPVDTSDSSWETLTDTSDATCWICQQDYSEEPANAHKEWRTPCPCSATAHNDCLIEWIKKRPRPFEEVKCPICTTVLVVDRPVVGHIAEFLGTMELAYKISVLPTTMFGVVFCLYGGSLLYGKYTLSTVFGREETRKLLTPTKLDLLGIWGTSRVVDAIRQALNFVAPGKLCWKELVAVPLIAPTLIIWKSGFIDRIFDIMPFFYFAFHRNTQLTPASTIAMLPWIRSTYNEIYAHTFAAQERRWDAAVYRPRSPALVPEPQGVADFINRQDQADQANQFNNPPAPAPAPAAEGENEDDGVIFGIDVAIEENGGPDNPNGDQPVRRNYPTAGALNTIVGALLFPSIAASVGGLFALTLPAKIVDKGRGATGLISEKWGRVVVGGACFAVIRDAVLLYGKWRRARAMQDVKVRNWNGPRRTR